MKTPRPFNPLRHGCLLPAAPVTPAQAQEIFANRKVAENVYRFSHSRRKPSGTESIGMADVTPGPPSIAELARALNLTNGDLKSVDLIYEFVSENIDFIPTFGLHKGGLGALIDGCGNSFDQSDLMIQLLEAAGGYSDIFYVIGVINLTPTQWSNWLGVDSSDPSLAVTLLNNGGIGATYDESSNNVQLNHCWVQVTVPEHGACAFDPTFKTYSYTSGIDIATATSYSRSTFLSRATAGSTITADFAQNINNPNIDSDLTGYTTNLIDWINSSSTPGPGATLDQIVGGRDIQPVDGPVRQPDLPYHDTLGYDTLYTYPLPTNYVCTIEVQYGPGTGTPALYYIDETFYTNEIYSERMTIWFDGSNVASLNINGTAVATSSTAQSSSTAWELNLVVTHPYAWPDPTLTANFNIVGGAQTTVGMGLGVSNSQMAQYHQEQQNITYSTGPSAGAENMLGQSLLLIFDNYVGQTSMGLDLANRMGGCATVVHQFLGAISQSTIGSESYITVDTSFAFNTSALSSSADIPSVALTTSLLIQMLEGPACQQVTGIASTGITGLIQACNNSSSPVAIYGATSSNWTTGANVENIMTRAGYPSSALASVSSLISKAWMVMMPQNGSVSLGSLTGVYGYLGLSTSASTGGVGNSTSLMWLSGLPYKGALSTQSQTTPQTNAAANTNATQVNAFGLPANTSKAAQVNVWNGRYEFSATDLTVGNQGHPYELAFIRSYNSALRLTQQNLGFGWCHNWQMTAASNSDGFMMFGYQRPMAAVPAIVVLYVCADVILSNEALPIENMVICSLVQQFLASQLVNNTVRLQFGAKFEVFTLLPNGTYLAPLGVSDLTNLTLSGGAYTLTTPSQVVYSYYSSGNIETIAFPYGITLTFTYSGTGGTGNLTNVSNGFRTLTFYYDGYGNLYSVGDGNERYVYLNISTDYLELTSVEDPMTNTTTYSYNDPSYRGQLYQVFQPANPTTAVLTNSYDSLGRIETQTDAYSNVLSYYIAGSRTQMVDALGNAQIQYFDSAGSTTRSINGLGQETDYQYDGNERCLKITLPEGNGASMDYDQYGRVLSQTQFPKPSSSLPTRTTNYTYGGLSQWYNVTQVEDPAGNVTNASYVTVGMNGASRIYQVIQPPPVSGGPSPTTTNTYTEIGQLLTTTDPTGIVTTNAYGTSPYNLLSTSVGPADLGIKFQYTFDDIGNIASSTDANLNTSTFVYDNNRRLTQATGPAPFSPTGYATYDANGNVTQTQSLASTDANCKIITATYSVDNLILTATGPNNYGSGSQPVSTIFSYDSLRRVSKIVDPAGTVFIPSYDALNRSVSTSVGGSTQWTVAYTENGQILSVADALSNSTQYQYDGFDRLAVTTYPDSSTEQVIEYDVLDNVLCGTSRAGVTFNYVVSVRSVA